MPHPEGDIPLSYNLSSQAPKERSKDETIERYRRILNRAVHTAIITVDASGRVTGWSDGARSMFGWEEAEMLGCSIERVFPPEEGGVAAWEAELAEARRTGYAGGEGWRQRKDGQRFWAIGELTWLQEGQPEVGFVKIVRDRTDRRHDELALIEQKRALEILNRAGAALARETQLEVLVQTVTDAGVALSGAEFGAFFYNLLNEAGESYMLYTLSGVPRETFSKFPMPRKTEVFAPTFAGEAIVRSDDITLDPRYGHNQPHLGMPKGHLPVRSYLAVPVVSRSGEVIGGLFFGHSHPGVFTADSERNMVGLAGEAAVAIDNARLYEAAQREIAERKKVDAALRELNADLEEQVRRRTEELVSQGEALRQAQKMEAIGLLTGGIAHDFNNILQVIVGNLDMLARTLPPELARHKRAATSAMAGAKRAASLTKRLLAFARRQPLDPKPLDVNLVVQGTSELLRRALGETVELETVLGGGLWTVEADPNELESALLNLAVNARDAMPGGGKLTIETVNAHLDDAYAARHVEVKPGQYVLICVSDTGIGMDDQTLTRVFEPFFTTKPEGKGTGLGLSQVYGFAKQSHGHIKLYSEVGKGTTVKLYLPRLYQEVTSEDSVGGELGRPEGSGETILVVEDDPDVRATSVNALRDLGYVVIEATDGPSALGLLKMAQIDLLFTDVVLPGGMTGADIANQAREITPNLKVLFTTGYARNAIVHHGRLDAGVQLITKPFTFDDLAARVRDVLDNIG